MFFGLDYKYFLIGFCLATAFFLSYRKSHGPVLTVALWVFFVCFWPAILAGRFLRVIYEEEGGWCER